MWGSGGRAYDEISKSIAEGIEHCILRLDPKPDEHVLDLATGTAWASRRVAAQGANTTGVDISTELLTAARDLAAEAGLSIAYESGDAEALSYGHGTFNAVISTFGVMFAPNQEAAASELARVSRRGGRIAAAAWLRATLGDAFELGFEKGVLHQRVPDAETYWAMNVEGFGPVRAVAASLDNEDRTKLRKAFIEWAEQFSTDLGIAIPFQYLITVGHRR
jgi:ubiquinone/menaquinone biosynthesis C-methylase UbiE